MGRRAGGWSSGVFIKGSVPGKSSAAIATAHSSSLGHSWDPLEEFELEERFVKSARKNVAGNVSPPPVDSVGVLA